MTIDERLDLLTERVDVIAQTVELLVLRHQDVERDFAELRREHEKRIAQIMDAIGRLAHIADIHERRTEDLEDRE